MRAQEFVIEVNAPGELTVPEDLVQRFTDAGWTIEGEGHDQIVLSKPNSNYVLKIVGQGSSSRIDQIRRYIDFYRRNQRNPHWPRVGGDRLLKWGDKTYYAYTQEKLQHLPGDEAVLDYLENAMGEIGHGEEPDFSKIPPGLSARDIDGLINAVDALFSADIGGQYQFDLSNVYNIMQRPNGQLVIVDPFAGWDDDEALDESAVAEGRGVNQRIEEFLDSLSPDDVGVEEFPGYRVHYEGFTDDCKSSIDYQKNPNRVYKQVYQDFIDREGGRKPVKSSMVGDEEYPILYSVFKVPQSKTIDTAEKAYNIAYRKKQPWPRGSREEKLIRSNWQLSGLYDQYVLKQGVAEGGAETSWKRDTETLTLQDILELTKHIQQINLPINDNLKSKLLHWDGNPEEIERINQVTVSKQFPILIMLDEQGQIDWILDGNHRLHKAIKAQAETIPAKLIKPSDLNDKAKYVFGLSKQGVAEKVNHDIAKKDWRDEKIISVPDVGELRLVGRNISDVHPPQFVVDVFAPDGQKIGYFRFLIMDYEQPKKNIFGQIKKPKKDSYVIGGNISVWREYQRKGIARQVYQWIKSLGNDIQPSTTQTAAGKAMWKSFDRQDMAENFADGKVKGKSRPGRVKRAGASCAGSVTDLRAKARKYGGERGRMYHWCANMKSGRKK